MEETNQSKRRWFGRSKRKERGASLVLVSGSLVAFVAIAALAVDYGQLVVERRAMVTATDAASLAAATVYASGGIDGCDEALSYMNANAPGHENFSCQYFPETGGGVVEVSSSQTVSFGFGSVLGVNSGTAASSTASEFIGSVAPGIRPFMLCESYSPEFTAWLNDRSLDPPANLRFTMSTNLSECLATSSGPGGPGNWAIVDFSNSGGSPGTSLLSDWIEFGSPSRPDACVDDGVTCPAVPETCDVDSTACIDGSTGVLRPAFDPVLDQLKTDGTTMYLPVVRDFTTAGAGSNLEARIDQYVPAKLIDYDSRNPAQVRWMEFTFLSDEDAEIEPAVRICGATATDCP